jgi:hypothetical protein
MKIRFLLVCLSFIHDEFAVPNQKFAIKREKNNRGEFGNHLGIPLTTEEENNWLLENVE